MNKKWSALSSGSQNICHNVAELPLPRGGVATDPKQISYIFTKKVSQIKFILLRLNSDLVGWRT